MLDDYKVYRHWYDFTNWTIQKVDTFPRSVRYSVSGRILTLTLEIMENVISSVYNNDRITKLDETNLKLKILSTLWRISLDNRWISVKTTSTSAGMWKYSAV